MYFNILTQKSKSYPYDLYILIYYNISYNYIIFINLIILLYLMLPNAINSIINNNYYIIYSYLASST